MLVLSLEMADPISLNFAVEYSRETLVKTKQVSSVAFVTVKSRKNFSELQALWVRVIYWLFLYLQIPIQWNAQAGAYIELASKLIQIHSSHPFYSKTIPYIVISSKKRATYWSE